MSVLWRRWAVAVLLLCVLCASGCVKLRQTLTVMPDGSGKIALRYGLSAEQIAMAKESDVDPFREVLPQVMADKCVGLVAFTEPSTETEGGYTYLSYTAYFRDINKVRINGLGEGTPGRYRFTREGDGATLTVTGGTVLSLLAQHEPVPEQERADSRKAMVGLSLHEHFVLPGKVEPVKGLTVDNDTAKLDLTLEDLLAGTGPVEALKGQNTLTLKVPEVTTDDAAAAAFADELEAAVQAWEAKQQAP